jgi:hypothetical protein
MVSVQTDCTFGFVSLCVTAVMVSVQTDCTCGFLSLCVTADMVSVHTDCNIITKAFGKL